MVEKPVESEAGLRSLWRYTKLICLGVIVLSVLSCVAMAAIRSVGLTHVTVVALDEDAEPRDHNLPFIKQKDALPDYRLTVNTTGKSRIDLGAKPNQSGVGGLTWRLPEPVSTSDVSSVRLDEQDKILSDAIAEVQFTDETVRDGNYQFEFATERSFSVGIQSFFKTPVGMAITAAFTMAILLIIFYPFFVIAG